MPRQHNITDLPQVDESEVVVQERLAQRALNPTGFRPIDNIAPEVSYIDKVACQCLYGVACDALCRQ